MLIVTSFVALIVWMFLLVFWGSFWRCDQYLQSDNYCLEEYPEVSIIIPARNEAAEIQNTLESLLKQDYQGQFRIILVDDQSEDDTANLAQATADSWGKKEQLDIIYGRDLPLNWTGKLWAMEQGVNYAQTHYPQTVYYLFTDADIIHAPDNLRRLVQHSIQGEFALVSLMVKLRCQSFWEKCLIPAFIFFFQKLYPFTWVNNPQRRTGAAAGGCILIKTSSLKELGGLSILQNALIDDCSLAKLVKDSSEKIWLGLTETTYSRRAYDSLQTIWDMVARTAYTQLNYSPWLLLGTLISMGLVYLWAPVGVIWGILSHNYLLLGINTVTWLLMTIAYLPTLKFYQCSPLRALTLPAIAFLYTLMTWDSAWRHWQGKGGIWKGRIYSQSS